MSNSGGNILDNDLWDNDLIQFTRLLAEIVATQELDIVTIAESMNLTPSDVQSLLERAHIRWEQYKKKAIKEIEEDK